jgi:hypothetical protein
MRRLARFRADPSRIRVSIRPLVGGWKVTIASRDGHQTCSDIDADLERALDRALAFAEHLEFPGIDRHMSWSYQHPMWKEDIHALS